MTTHGDATRARQGEAHLALARANFEPIEQFLRQINDEGVVGTAAPCEVELTEEMRLVATNTCDVLYSVRHPTGQSVLLRFTMVGEGADRILFQVQHRSAHGEERASAGTVDQHVYRLDEVDELRKAVRTRIIVFLAR